LSTTKNGGQFEFTITPKANPALDQTNIVFGKIIDGIQVVDLLNESPSTQGQFLEGAFKVCVLVSLAHETGSA
jgi:cyclophilin family peptidyl-prolyl cis-trans isomerase